MVRVQVSTIMSSIGTTHQCDDLVANQQHSFSTIVLDNPVALDVGMGCVVNVVPVPLIQLSLLQFSGTCASQRLQANSSADSTSSATTLLAGDACKSFVNRSSPAFCLAPAPSRRPSLSSCASDHVRVECVVVSSLPLLLRVIISRYCCC
jgi:hypothetical protein